MQVKSYVCGCTDGSFDDSGGACVGLTQPSTYHAFSCHCFRRLLISVATTESTYLACNKQACPICSFINVTNHAGNRNLSGYYGILSNKTNGHNAYFSPTNKLYLYYTVAWSNKQQLWVTGPTLGGTNFIGFAWSSTQLAEDITSTWYYWSTTNVQTKDSIGLKCGCDGVNTFLPPLSLRCQPTTVCASGHTVLVQPTPTSDRVCS